MSKTDVTNEVSKYLTAALNAAPGDVRDVLRSEAPAVVRSLATLATSGAKSSDRKWAFVTFFNLIRSTITKDAELQNAIAHRHRREAEHILAAATKIKAKTESEKSARRQRADVQQALRTISAAKRLNAS
jgi:hypothetical protein